MIPTWAKILLFYCALLVTLNTVFIVRSGNGAASLNALTDEKAGAMAHLRYIVEKIQAGDMLHYTIQRRMLSNADSSVTELKDMVEELAKAINDLSEKIDSLHGN